MPPGNFYLPKCKVFFTRVLQRRARAVDGYAETCSWFQVSITFQDLFFLHLYP